MVVNGYISGWWCNVPILKNDGVCQWLVDDIPYMKRKIKTMFETTNQYVYIYICQYNTYVGLPVDLPIKNDGSFHSYVNIYHGNSLALLLHPVPRVHGYSEFTAPFPPLSSLHSKIILNRTSSMYPLVNVYITMENHHFWWDNQLFLWPFSIANC